MGQPRTLVEALRRAAGSEAVQVRFQDRPGQVEAYGYREILQRARQVAAGLAKIGVQPGDRVALVLPTSIHFYDAFFGVLFSSTSKKLLHQRMALSCQNTFTISYFMIEL